MCIYSDFDRLLKCLLSTMSLLVFLREAKSIHQSLKELLKAKEPFDKEVDFQRKRFVPYYYLLNAGS